MEKEARLRMDALEAIAKQDPLYQQLLQQLALQEKEYNLALHQLEDRERNAVCDFVSQCEEISWRMLELACEHMRF